MSRVLFYSELPLTSKIMQAFDFDAVARYYAMTNWLWASTGMRSPTAFDIQCLAQDMLVEVEIKCQGFQHAGVYDYWSVSTGGLMVVGTYRKDEGVRLDLHFVAVEASARRSS